MNSPTVGLRVAAAVFGLVALAQLLRIATGVDIVVAGHTFPLWPNAIALLVAGSLSLWMLKLSRLGAH